MLEKGIRARRGIEEVMFPGMLVVGDITNWYQSQHFNSKPGWAMLVEVEAKVSENNFF
jgi:hypothetical protein